MPKRRSVLIFLFALALVPRLLLLALRPGDLEFWEYETLAQNVAAGNGYVISHFGHLVLAFGDGNLYSFLAATIYATVGHHPLVLGAIQALLASLAAPVLYILAERPLGWTRAALGAGLAALHPGLLAYTLKLHPLGLDVLLISLVVMWSLRTQWLAGDRVLAGLTLGLNLMSRPTYFVASLASLSVGWLSRRTDRRSILAAMAIGLLVAAPWVVRNWALLGQPMLISTSMEDVWKGNNLLASGSSYVAPGVDVFDAAPGDLRARIYQADELQANQLFTQETLSFISERPDQFAGLAARKFVYFWWLPQAAGLLYPSGWLTAYQVYAVLMYAFMLVGSVGILRNGSAAERNLLATVVAVALTLAVIHALAYVEGRHRWGIEPLLLLLAARGCFSAATALRGLSSAPQLRLLRRASER